MHIFVITLLVFVVATHPVRSSLTVRALGYDPAQMLRFAIIFAAALWILPVLERPQDTEYYWFIYFFLAAYISVLALATGTRIRPRQRGNGVSSSTVTRLLIVASAPYTIFVIGTGVLNQQLSDIFTLSMLELRLNHWERFGNESSPIRLLLGSAAFPVALLWPHLERWSLKYLYSLFILSTFLINALSIGSRMQIAFAAVVILLSMLMYRKLPRHLRKPMRPMSKLLITCAGLTTLYYIFYFALAERVIGIEYQFAFLSELVLGAPPTEFFIFLNEVSEGVVGTIVLTAGYFSSSLTFFEKFMSEAEYCNCRMQLGAYNFPFLDGLFQKNWFEIRSEIADFWSSRGYATNPWATALRDFVIDFGLVGAIVFASLLFSSLGILIRRAAAAESRIGYMIAAYFTAICLVTPFQSPLFILELSLPMYGLAILAMVLKARRAAGGMTRETKLNACPAAF